MNSTCVNCGQKFSCGLLSGQKKCWCAGCPKVEIDKKAQGCLCPRCLDKIPSNNTPKKISWRLLVSYVGTNYHGWQKQPSHSSVEEKLENALFKITKQQVSLTVAGRTDSGVHAAGQVVSCTFESRLDSRRLLLALGSVLPSDIAVWRADEMPVGFNAKRQSVGKRYVYQINQSLARDVFLDQIHWHLRRKLNVKDMNNAAKYLVGEHDFESFRSLSCDAAHAKRHVWYCGVSLANSVISIDIRGNAFCHNMVRIIVGTLVEVGFGKLRPNDLPKILEAKDRTLSGQTAPPYGLCLDEVYYPDDLCFAQIPYGVVFPRFPVTKESWPFNSADIIRGPMLSE